jgi:hypothetical protein
VSVRGPYQGQRHHFRLSPSQMLRSMVAVVHSLQVVVCLAPAVSREGGGDEGGGGGRY